MCWLLMVAGALSAQSLPLREIEAPGWDRGGEDDLFGYALAVDGPQLIVGIPGAPTNNAAGAGMVEVYSPTPGGWTLAQRLLPVQNFIDEKFGIALAQSGDDLAVGSWDAGFGNGEVPGSVHMYRRVGGLWQNPQRLVPLEVDTGDAFGSAVALAGDWFAVSAPQYDDESGVRGAVFLYRRAGASWTLAQRIEGSDVSRPGGFGCAIAMAVDRLYVGDCRGDAATANTGSVSWYRLDTAGATLGGTIAVADVESGDQYGYAISATATHLVVAAAIGANDSENTPRVYFFCRSGDDYVLQKRQALPSFALSLQLTADRALVAGPVCASTTTPGRNIACVRRFDRSAQTWTESAPYLQQPEVGNQGFGLALAADANAIHVGNPFRNVAAGPSSGAVSTFGLAAPGTLPAALELPAGLWRFGFNTIVDGTLMVATDARQGALDQTNEGMAWVFDIASADAQLLTRIDTPEPYAYERFASDVGVAGNRIVLSAVKRTQGGSTLALRTYQRTGSAINFIDEFDVFSLPVLADVVVQLTFQMSGDRLAVWGAVPTLRGQSPRIAVLLRQGNSWQLEALLQPPAQEEEAAINFSRMVMQGDRIALLRGETQPLAGQPRGWAVFVYRRSGTQWNLEATLRPNASDPPTTVLQDVVLNGDELAISTGDALQNIFRARVHTFAFEGASWAQTERIDEPPNSSNFARQLAIENGLLIIESFPTTAINDNFVSPLTLYRRHGNDWSESARFLPSLAPIGQGRLFDFSNPQLIDGRLFAGGRREGPGITTHTHGVMFEFDALDALFSNAFE